MRFIQNYKVPYLKIHKRLVSSTTHILVKDDLPATAYRPEIVEKNKYDKWEKDGRFKAENPSNKPTFSMVLPPPNVTGKLHLGHALACTVQDVIVRRKRAMCQNVLWLPGTDHAGIATQGVVEKYLKSKQNINRHDIGREKFIKEVWKWKDKHGDSISKQLRTLGCSLDWSRQVFTMDPKLTHAVNTAFINLFQKGLIYRKKALVNWCNSLKSTVSDIEVENVPINGPTDMILPNYDKPVKFGFLYEITYKIYDSNDEIVVSTTMPESMLGDTAIAVHPNDKRYKHLIGKLAIHPFANKIIPIISDDFVDVKFGTGAVKITPAHSKIDNDIAKCHKLSSVQIINEEGVMINSEQFNNLKRYDCRQILLQKLDELGLLKATNPHQMTLPICSRSGNVIDHLPKEQWFLSCSKLNEKAALLVKDHILKIEPEKFVKNWLNWTGDDRDWCISRQLWWGHQIPAYKCSADKNLVWIAAIDEGSAKLQASKYLRTLPETIKAERDTDVLDTWFSSGIYPFAALGWPDCRSDDYKQFYPLSLMATGHDILGFWVHRMVMLGLELTDKIPFENVLLHGIICDTKGAKMSKSKGNVIDPIDIINGITMQKLKEKSEDMHKNGVLSKEELKKALAYHKSNFSKNDGIPECGVDALRFTLLSHDIKSHYVNFDLAMCQANKLFCNKIWQSIKYTQLFFAKLQPCSEEITQSNLAYFDRWILSRLAEMVAQVNRSMETHDFHLATKALKQLIYNEFCDVYLEATKFRVDNDNIKIGYGHAHTLSAVLNTSLRCLSPFMIYVTEELIPKIPGFEKNIIFNFNDLSNNYFQFPMDEDFKVWKNNELEGQVDKLMSTINVVRELKGLYTISNKERPEMRVKTNDLVLASDIRNNKSVVLNLARCSNVTFGTEKKKNHVSSALDKDTEISIEIVGNDVENMILSARNSIQNKIKKLEETIAKLEKKYTSNRYVSTSSELKQVLEKENLITKRKELEELQRLSKMNLEIKR